jgi:hypothetical protein
VEDNPERPLLDISPTATTPGSWYHDASSTQQSPVQFHTANAEFDTMRLREISGNERRSPPPLSLPLARQVRGRKKRGVDLRKTSFEASEYIEHIENELQEVKEAMHSPSTGKPLQEKLKILQAENKQLKETMSELEDTFDERVKQAVEHKAAIEVNMRKKIKALEDELASKENTISDLEHDRDESKYDSSSIDALRAMVDRLEQEKECLEEANRVVEKRNEALTGLLAQSPTRSHHGFELASPIRQDSRRTPRPKSMMIPKLASSPRSENYQRPQSVQISPVQSSTSYFSPNNALNLEHHHPCNAGRETDLRKISDSESFDSGLGDSCSARSPARGSRRSSIASHVSASPSAWGLPLPTSPSNETVTVKQNKHRRTRRFESGSTQLKPLLLPTMAAEGNPFQTSYTTTFYSSPICREFSDQSLDPTTSFLSRPFETPIPRPSLPSKWVSETALKALEGFSESRFETFEDIAARGDCELAVLASSSVSDKMPEPEHEEDSEESDPPIFCDNTIVEEDVTAFLNHLGSPATDEQMFSSLNGEASFTSPDQDRTWISDQNVTSPTWQSSSATQSELQQSNDNGMHSDYKPLRRISAPSSQELMPEPLFLPSALNRTAGTSNQMTQRASLILVSGKVDDSPIPRKRQRSGDPDSCSFVMPTLCVNPAHKVSIHEQPLFKAPVGASKTLTDTDSKPRSSKPSSRPRSPLERLHKRTASSNPLTSVTIHTIFGTLCRYTSYVRELRRDPTALARRVIANAWHNHWKRLGKLSWWVLGLFLGPGAKTERLDGARSIGSDCDRYDGEAIAGEVCDSDIRATEEERNGFSQHPLLRASDPRLVRIGESDSGYRTAGTKAKAKPALKQDNQNRRKQKPSWRKSLYLWGKFSVAIILAVGGAVINGPEEMLRDCAEHPPRKTARTIYEQTADDPQNGAVPEEQRTSTDANTTPVTKISQPADASKTLVTGLKLPLEARLASGGSPRSFSGAGAGPTLGVVKPGRSSLKTPSPARRRRRVPVPDLAAGKECTFGSPCGTEDWDQYDDNGCGRAGKTRTRVYSQSNDSISGAQPDNENGGLGTLQWVQNLNVTNFQVDDEEDAVQFNSKRGKRTHSLMN